MTFTLTYPEFKQAFRAIEGERKGGRTIHLLMVLVLCASLGVAVYLTIVRRFFHPSPSAAAHTSETIIGMLIFAYVGWRMVDLFEGRFKRAWMNARDLRVPQEVELIGASLRFASARQGERLIPINNYQRVVETKDVVVLIADLGADVLPKRALDPALLELVARLPKVD